MPTTAMLKGLRVKIWPSLSNREQQKYGWTPFQSERNTCFKGFAMHVLGILGVVSFDPASNEVLCCFVLIHKELAPCRGPFATQWRKRSWSGAMGGSKTGEAQGRSKCSSKRTERLGSSLPAITGWFLFKPVDGLRGLMSFLPGT